MFNSVVLPGKETLSISDLIASITYIAGSLGLNFASAKICSTLTFGAEGVLLIPLGYLLRSKELFGAVVALLEALLGTVESIRSLLATTPALRGRTRGEGALLLHAQLGTPEWGSVFLAPVVLGRARSVSGS